MSNIPISSLPGANPLTGEETVPIVQAGTTKRATTGAISALPFGSAAGSASGISFITVSSATAALPSSRTLAATSPVLLTDGGAGAPITISMGGVLDVPHGGTGTATVAANCVLIGDGAGSSISSVSAATTNGYFLTSIIGGPPEWQFHAGVGTVTSVGLSGGTTGLTISNSPITGNGTMTLGGYLNGTAIATASITSTQIATNTIGFSKIQQAAGLSVIGVAGSAPANLAPITGAAGQTLRINAGGTAALFTAPLALATVQGLHGENTSGSGSSKYSFEADSVLLVGTASAFIFSSVGTTTCDVLLSGPVVNGRDQSAAFSVSQFLHFYWITDGATLGLTVSSTAPPTGPTLPSGYKAWAYAAPIRYASSTSLASTHVCGNNVFNRSSPGNILSNGNATSFAAISLANFIPTNATDFTINAQYIGLLASGTGGSAQGTVHWSADGVNDYTTSAYQVVGFPSGATLLPLTDISFPNRNQTFYYYTQVLVGATPAVTLTLTRYRIPNGG